MAVILISVKCPACGATLDIEEDRDSLFCSYCGKKLLLHKEQDHIYSTIDEAGMKEAEEEKLAQMRQLELLEISRVELEKARSLTIRFSFYLAAAGILMMILGSAAGYASGDPSSGLYIIALTGVLPLFAAAILWRQAQKRELKQGRVYEDLIKVPDSISNYERKSYSAIEAMFVIAGFTNVRCVPLKDLSIGVLKKPGLVDSITINGRDIAIGGSKYPRDAAVIISYHSFNR